MGIVSDYVGIRGWCATVESITPQRKEGKIGYVVGHMTLLPRHKDRRVILDGKDLGLDVFFHCYTEEVAVKFFEVVKNGDTLIVSGDLNSRDWLENEDEPDTNFWLDEFLVDGSKHTVAPLSGKIDVADEEEYLIAANYRYAGTCVFCGEDNNEIADHLSDRMYCGTCDE
jgi:hypothetical protein